MAARNTRPGVLIFCAGNAAIRTPNLDRLAARGAAPRIWRWPG